MCHKIYKKSGEFKLGENPNLKNKKKSCRGCNND